MRIAEAHLKSASIYSQSKYIKEKKLRDETHEDHEARCWKQRCHVDGNGIVFIPPMCFKNAIAAAAKYKSEKIPGAGKNTYTKHFEAGVMVVEPLSLGVHIDDVQSDEVHVPSDGRRGGSTRVLKTFPIFLEWEGVVKFLVFDDLIDGDVFYRTLVDSGQFIGVGRFRPRNNGYYGRFDVIDVKWTKQ